MRNLKTVRSLSGRTVLRLLSEHAGLYQPGQEAGILPINFILTPGNLVEKGQFLFIGRDPGQCREMLRRVEEDLPIRWEYARD